MPLTLANKKSIVSEISSEANKALSAVVANYSGVSVNKMTELRKKAREADVYLKVVQNNLAKLAVTNTNFECMKDIFLGPLVLAFSRKEPGASAKLFEKFIQDNKELEVKYLSIGGELFTADKLEEISKLPSREEALVLLCNVLKAPLSKLVRTTNAIPERIVRVFDALKDNKS